MDGRESSSFPADLLLGDHTSCRFCGKPLHDSNSCPDLKRKVRSLLASSAAHDEPSQRVSCSTCSSTQTVCNCTTQHAPFVDEGEEEALVSGAMLTYSLEWLKRIGHESATAEIWEVRRPSFSYNQSNCNDNDHEIAKVLLIDDPKTGELRYAHQGTQLDDLLWHRWNKEVMLLAYVTRALGTSVPIVEYRDHGISPERGATVLMKKYDRTLADLGEEFGLPLHEVICLRALEDVCTALVALHSIGIVHLDVKPQNVLFDARTGTFVLGDFGISVYSTEVLEGRAPAQLVSVEQFNQVRVLYFTRQLHAVERAGTPPYLCWHDLGTVEHPGRVSGKTDVYSLAQMAWYLCTGVHYNPGYEHSAQFALKAICLQAFSPAHEMRPTAEEFRYAVVSCIRAAQNDRLIKFDLKKMLPELTKRNSSKQLKSRSTGADSGPITSGL